MQKIFSLLRRIYKARLAYLFLLPQIILIAVYSYYPAFSGLYHSFFQWDSTGNKLFIGLDNFKELFQDKIFLNSFSVLLEIMIPRLIISVVVPLIVAELIFGVRSSRLKYLYRVLILLPMVAPGVVGTLIWKNIYDPNNGLMVAVCRLLGIVGQGQAVDWLGDPNLIIFSIIFQGFPWVGGTSVLVYMSGLSGISSEVIESSVLDGAGRIRRFFSIDLPAVMGQIKYFLVFGIIGGIQDYSTQIILTNGGPGFRTMVPGYYMFTQAFKADRMGYASAMGTVLFFLILIITILTMKFVKSSD